MACFYAYYWRIACNILEISNQSKGTIGIINFDNRIDEVKLIWDSPVGPWIVIATQIG